MFIGFWFVFLAQEGVAKGPIFQIPTAAPLMECGHKFSNDPLTPQRIGAGGFADTEVGKEREQDAVSFADTEVGKEREHMSMDGQY